MNTMYYARVDRRDFGDLMSAERLSRMAVQRSDVGALRTHAKPLGNSLIVVWSTNPHEIRELPTVLICEDGTESDWAAWITTFAARIRPFSAYMRLVTQNGLQVFTNEERRRSLRPLMWPLVGMILGEVLAASRLNDTALESISATACSSTLSFAMFRAASAYSAFEEWPDLFYAWEHARHLTKQRPRSVEGAEVARACAAVIHAAGGGGPEKMLTRSYLRIAEACRELMFSQGSTLDVIKFPGFAAIRERMRGSREDRVIAFGEFLNTMDSAGSDDPELTPFILGYLASRIAPGTMRHASVLQPLVPRHPTALLWYGFCAGLGQADGIPLTASAATSVDLPASARRVARDLFHHESLLAPPTCDIAFSELLALSRTSADPIHGLVTTTQSAALVELLPAVCTAVNMASRPSVDARPRQRREREIIASLEAQVERLRDTFKELSREDISSDTSEQPTLFPSRRRKK